MRVKLSELELQRAPSGPESDLEEDAGSSLGGLSDDAPEGVFEQNDVIAEMIKSGAEVEIDHPYCPHPDARALDSEVTPSFGERELLLCAQIREQVGATSRVLGVQLRRVLAARALSRVERDRRSGRLDTRRLHTLNRPGRAPNKRVFKRQIEGATVSTSVAIFVDQSGSMRDNGKMICARQSAIALGDALEPLSSFGVRFSIWGFQTDPSSMPGGSAHRMEGTDRLEPIQIRKFKEFDEPWKKAYGRVGSMVPGANNCDGESLRWAGHRLLFERTERKILLVLSDGRPAFRSSYSFPHAKAGVARRRSHKDLRDAVAEVTKAGIEVLGLGICSEAVREFYPNNIVIRDPKDLEGALMQALRGFLIGRAA